MYVTGACDGSERRIAEVVTQKVRKTWNADDLARNGWDKKAFVFGRGAMRLVVEAIDQRLLEWDAEMGLGVLGQFFATPEWLAIPRREPAS
jgi:hypothetical protein